MIRVGGGHTILNPAASSLQTPTEKLAAKLLQGLTVPASVLWMPNCVATLTPQLAVTASSTNIRSHDGEGFLAGYDFTTRVRGALIKAREEAHRRYHEY